MNLKELFVNLLKEQEEESLEAVDDTVVEFPEHGFSVSFFREEKKLLFTPQQEELPDNATAFVEIMKEKFRISEEGAKEIGTYEILFDPREDFEQVIEFILNQINVDAEEEEIEDI